MNYLKLAIHTGFGVALVVAVTATVEAQTFIQSPDVVQQGFVQQGFVQQQGFAQQTQPVQQPTEEQLKQLRIGANLYDCLLYTSPSPRDRTRSRMPSSA